MTPNTPHVYSAICAVSAAVAKSGIGKERKNVAQGYAFRGIDDVYNALAHELAAARLCILPRVLTRDVREVPTKSGGVMLYVVVAVEFDFVSAEDGSRHVVSTYGEAMDTGDKATNKAMSAAYKYMAMQAFCIPTEGDHDADAHSPEPAAMGRPTAADTAARRATHDPSWSADQRHYFASLSSLGVSKEDADGVATRANRPRPSQMPQEQRDAFLSFLGSEKGRAAIETHHTLIEVK